MPARPRNIFSRKGGKSEKTRTLPLGKKTGHAGVDTKKRKAGLAILRKGGNG